MYHEWNGNEIKAVICLGSRIVNYFMLSFKVTTLLNLFFGMHTKTWLPTQLFDSFMTFPSENERGRMFGDFPLFRK